MNTRLPVAGLVYDDNMTTKRKSFLPFLQENVKLVSFCPLCETHYNLMEARVIEERGNTHLIHIQCQQCRSLIIVLVTATSAGVSSIGMVTDLTADDVLRFRNAPSVAPDDVLNFHELLAIGAKVW